MKQEPHPSLGRLQTHRARGWCGIQKGMNWHRTFKSNMLQPNQWFNYFSSQRHALDVTFSRVIYFFPVLCEHCWGGIMILMKVQQWHCVTASLLLLFLSRLFRTLSVWVNTGTETFPGRDRFAPKAKQEPSVVTSSKRKHTLTTNTFSDTDSLVTPVWNLVFRSFSKSF